MWWLNAHAMYVDYVWELWGSSKSNNSFARWQRNTHRLLFHRSFIFYYSQVSSISCDSLINDFMLSLFFARSGNPPLRIIILTFFSLQWNLILLLSSQHPNKRMCIAAFFFVTYAWYIINHQRLMLSLVSFMNVCCVFFCRSFRLKFHRRNIVFISAVFLFWFTILCMLKCLSVHKPACVYSANIYHIRVWIFA